MIAALIASIFANVALAYFFVQSIGDARSHSAGEHATARAERAELLQRIQAPEQAILEHAVLQEVGPQPRAVSEFDDADHWENQGLTTEALAEFAMQQELSRVA